MRICKAIWPCAGIGAARVENHRLGVRGLENLLRPQYGRSFNSVARENRSSIAVWSIIDDYRDIWFSSALNPCHNS